MDPSVPLRVAVAVCAAATAFDSGAALATPPMSRACVDCHGPVEQRRVVITGDVFSERRFDAAMTRFAAALQAQAEMRRVPSVQAVWRPAEDGGADLAGPPTPTPSRASPIAETDGDNTPLAPGWPLALLSALAWLARRRA